ncbi:MAG: hypothetical protein JO115_19620 [Pseudonocardiales bacterium]|nr:hypothetical protein [Pseudonocardiales bacterium]
MVALAVDERAVLEAGIARLAELLGPDFDISPVQASGGEDDEQDALAADSVYTIRALTPSAPYAQVVVEAKASLTPAAARQVLLPQVRLLRQLYSQATVLLVAPWLSPRTRDILASRKVGYLDFTGNVDLRLPTGVLIKTEGAQQNPDPTPHRRSRGLSGAGAGVIVRLLTDFAPPYRQKDLAALGRVSPGYVSRIFQTLDDEALITREGPYIVEVDWPALLRARAENYDLLRSNHAVPMVARTGPDALYRSLIARGTENTAVVTGSYAAREVTPVAVGGPLMIYVDPGPDMVDAVADELSLMRAARGLGNVILLQSSNSGILLDRRGFGATEHVALSQLAIDCLSGPDRMPAEGEAVLAHMVATVDSWRRDPGELVNEAAALS